MKKGNKIKLILTLIICISGLIIPSLLLGEINFLGLISFGILGTFFIWVIPVVFSVGDLFKTGEIRKKSSKLCLKCGTSISIDSHVCPNCGYHNKFWKTMIFYLLQRK